MLVQRDEALAQRDEALAQRDVLIEALQARIVELERRLGQNSKNSSRPPSGDRMERSPSRAEQRKAGRKPGKQPGGPGSTLRRTDTPDTVVEHVPAACAGCGAGLDDAPVVKTRARQVVDIPEVSASVTEHQIHSRRCACGQVTEAPAPAGAGAPVQYGPNLRALATYLVVYQHVPVERAAELIGDVTGARPSTGWISSVVAATSQQLVETDKLIRTLLILALVLHVDETTVNVNGDKWWLHVASTGTLTAYFLHTSRGRVAVDEFAILPAFTGVCVHDALSVYDGPDYATASHAFCGAHIARELVAAGQADPDQAWPAAALDALYGLNTAAHHARSEGQAEIAPGVLDPLLHRWKHALLCGLAAHPERDGPKQSKTRNLLTRLTARQEQVLRFARDLRVPLTNNQAERDLRPVKTQLKISGCHRSNTGAEAWLRIRGYISTMRKNGAPVLTGLRDAITGNPWTPATT